MQSSLHPLIHSLIFTYLKKFPEVWTAGREHHPVRSNPLSLTAQCDVYQFRVHPQVVKDRGDTALESIPLEAELLAIHGLEHSGTNRFNHACIQWLNS